jgi:hypothetical protein
MLALIDIPRNLGYLALFALVGAESTAYRCRVRRRSSPPTPGA